VGHGSIKLGANGDWQGLTTWAAGLETGFLLHEPIEQDQPSAGHLQPFLYARAYAAGDCVMLRVDSRRHAGDGERAGCGHNTGHAIRDDAG